MGRAARARPRATPPPCRPGACAPATTWPCCRRPPASWSPPSRRRGWPGATVVVLPLPMRLSSIEEFVAQTRQRIRNADAALCVVDPELAAVRRARARRPADGRASPTWPTATRGVGAPRRRPRPARHPAVHQRVDVRPQGRDAPRSRAAAPTSTPSPRRPQLDADDDVLVSWLPLYHDMGLVGLLTLPMTTGDGLVLGAPQDFTAAPARWMEWLSTYGGTATAGPELQLRARHPGPQPRRRASTCPACASPSTAPSPIDPDQVEAFVEAGARHGLRPGAVFPAFGMAEVAIAGTFPEPDARACAPTASTAGCSRPSATPPRSTPAPRAAAGSPLLGRAVPGPGDPHRRPRDRRARCATARSASSRSGARR